jgi:ELWxxDGT repeat protein
MAKSHNEFSPVTRNSTPVGGEPLTDIVLGGDSSIYASTNSYDNTRPRYDHDFGYGVQVSDETGGIRGDVLGQFDEAAADYHSIKLKDAVPASGATRKWGGLNASVSINGATGRFQQSNSFPNEAGGAGSLQSDHSTSGTSLSTRIENSESAHILSASGVGATMVKDIVSGAGNGINRAYANMVNVNGTLFFVANDGGYCRELWKSDGTEAGTVLVKKIRQDNKMPWISYLTNVNGTLFFAANDGANGSELWMSDGTEAGTHMVTDIWDGLGGSGPCELTNVNGALFFSANDGNYYPNHGRELWTCSTSGVACRVADIYVDPDANSGWPVELTNANGVLYFTATDKNHGSELWKSSGGVTCMVKDTYAGSSWHGPDQITAVGDRVFFIGLSDACGNELWVSDGSAAGTYMVEDVRPGTSGTPYNLTAVNGTLFFTENDGVHGGELWRSDGTSDGTFMVKDILPGAGSGANNSPKSLIDVDGTLFFVATDGVHGFELWKSDGTEAGTVMVKDIALGGAESSPTNLTNVNGTLYFTAYDSTHGRELWKSDGTEAGTVLVMDINPTGDSYAYNLTNVNGTLYFTATDGVHGHELWKASGGSARSAILAGAARDTLDGGMGNDTYRFGRGDGSDTIKDFDPTSGNADTLMFGPGIAADQLWLTRSGSDLQMGIIGGQDKATISNWYKGAAYQVEEFKTSDGKTLLNSQVDSLVSAMAAFAPPAPGQTTLPDEYRTALQPVIAANWK